jgi:hypothetical protein
MNSWFDPLRGGSNAFLPWLPRSNSPPAERLTRANCPSSEFNFCRDVSSKCSLTWLGRFVVRSAVLPLFDMMVVATYFGRLMSQDTDKLGSRSVFYPRDGTCLWNSQAAVMAFSFHVHHEPLCSLVCWPLYPYNVATLCRHPSCVPLDDMPLGADSAQTHRRDRGRRQPLDVQ